MSYAPDSAVTYIVIHYSATFIEREYTYSQLEADHKKKGYREGGYHAYVTYPRPGKPSRLIEGRDLSQPGRFEMGAHSKGENDESIGICFEGGLTRATGPNVGANTMHPDQERLIIEWIDRQLKRFPGAIIEGHRDMPGAKTQCPGFSGRDWWSGVLLQRFQPVSTLAQQTWVSALLDLLFSMTKGKRK